MNAHEINQLVEKTGITGLSNTFGISRRQAEAMHTSVLRAEHEGKGHEELPAGMISQGTRRMKSAPPMPGRALTTEETSHLPGANVDPAERSYAAQAARQRKYTLEKNVSQGYREWEHELGAMQ